MNERKYSVEDAIAAARAALDMSDRLLADENLDMYDKLKAKDLKSDAIRIMERMMKDVRMEYSIR
jgi:hypothetical protein